MIDHDVERAGALTDPDYWSPYWRDHQLPKTIDLADPVVRQLANSIKLYSQLTAGARVLEVGCAASAWLPFFYNQWGWEVEGVDYAASGCITARKNLELLGARGTIYEADIFDFAQTHPNRYDLVVSFGVVEHFTNPVEILKAMYSVLKPGGSVLVEIPHLLGIGGLLQRAVSQEIYDHHNPMFPGDLKHHLASAGFVRIKAGYIGREPLRVVNSPVRDTLSPSAFSRALSVRKVLDRGCSLAGSALNISPRWMGTYVLSGGTKPKS